MNVISQYINRIIVKLKKLLFLALVALINSIFSNRLRPAPEKQISTLLHSGIFNGDAGLDIEYVYKEWEKSEKHWNKGEYFKSNDLKRNCLEYVYSSQTVDEQMQILPPPPFMSIGWSIAIGHIGSLGAFVLGQKLGVVPGAKRCMPVRDERSSRMIRTFLDEDVTVVPARLGWSIFENPSQWHLSERLQMIRTHENFVSLYELHESVFSHSDVTNPNIRLSINSDYADASRNLLESLGLPRDSWFVGFHVREKPNSLDPRNAKIENFYPSLNEVVNKGGWVIRFGTDKMHPLPIEKNTIDLNEDKSEHRKLHLYIIAMAAFLLTTNSGPAVVAWSLGTPVLQTNTLAIARNILTASPGSIYLPKKYVSNGSRLNSFSEILGSLEGFAESNLKEKFNQGYQIIENSAYEIQQATLDMFRFLETGQHDQTLGPQVNDIRREHRAIGYGQIAPSFLSENANWFLR